MGNRPHLRLIFVQMLFALAIGQLALKCGDLVIEQCDLKNYFYAYSHLCVAAIILTTSWIGWQASESNTDANLSNYVVGFEFILLLIDIFLVIAYFIIVRGVEITPERQILPPNSSIELTWSTIIFATYILWDILTKGFPGPSIFKLDPQNPNGFIKIRERDKRFLKRIFPTMCCFGVSLAMCLFMSDDNTSQKIVIVDFMLMTLFITFRGLKQSIKREYHLPKDQISSKNLIALSELKSDVKFPISVKERIYIIKLIIIKVLPIAILFLLLGWYLLT